MQQRATRKKKKKRVHENRKKRVWRGNQLKNKPSYEGGQYAGGRKKGTKNLKKLDNGNLLNQHGIEFTPEEKKALESAANRANQVRNKMLASEAALPRLVAGQDTGQTVASLQAMGKESDFIITRKSKSLQRFKTKEDYYNYLDNLKRVSSPKYMEERVRLYKRNHIQALKNTFGHAADDIIHKIRWMPQAEYMRLLQQDEMLEIGFIYDPGDLDGRLNVIRAAFGMKLKEESMPNV